MQSPHGLLDALLPHVESGQIVVVGEIDPVAYELVAQLRPRVSRVFRVVRLAPMLEDEAVAVARDWTDTAGIEVADETIREALDLASHYLPGLAAPGSLIRILELAAERAERAGEAAVEPRTIIATLAEATGLPLHVLDPRAQLDLGAVRSFFAERVLGQPAAVETLVERIALVKAGLTDPTRPLGVFLFVGPTGTGKTEIAKRLAEFLFGSADRLVRLDMSEFQTPESLERLLTDSTFEPQASPLIASVRKEPFSVVLLDEFEKAHANIWDVFLQVFDDGRLTDRSGRVVDFRHCVIVLTSNVGSAIPTRPGLGFGSTVESFDTTSIERAVARAFRPELLNRLDRVVVFRPLEREVMRTLVEHELAAVLERRGFRMHPWAVEWDESAIDFLLEQGFTADLGARPLKRAVEQQLLAPLATTIVERQFPEGEQFLFITARGGRITVTFVDPDAAEDEPASAATAAPGTLDVRSLALNAEGSRTEVQFLADELERVERRLAPVGEEKATALARTREPDFWDGDGQTPTLARIEYLDRVEAALGTAGAAPLPPSPGARERAPAECRGRVACSPSASTSSTASPTSSTAATRRTPTSRSAPRPESTTLPATPATSRAGSPSCTSAGRSAAACEHRRSRRRTATSAAWRSPGSAPTRSSRPKRGSTSSSCPARDRGSPAPTSTSRSRRGRTPRAPSRSSRRRPAARSPAARRRRRSSGATGASPRRWSGTRPAGAPAASTRSWPATSTCGRRRRASSSSKKPPPRRPP